MGIFDKISKDIKKTVVKPTNMIMKKAKPLIKMNNNPFGILRQKQRKILDDLQKEIGNFYLGKKKNDILRMVVQVATANDTMATLKKKILEKLRDQAFKIMEKYKKLGAYTPIGPVGMKFDPMRFNKKANAIFNQLKKGLPLKEIKNLLDRIKKVKK
jgi:hypothetical protein